MRYIEIALFGEKNVEKGRIKEPKSPSVALLNERPLLIYVPSNRRLVLLNSIDSTKRHAFPFVGTKNLHSNSSSEKARKVSFIYNDKSPDSNSSTIHLLFHSTRTIVARHHAFRLGERNLQDVNVYVYVYIYVHTYVCICMYGNVCIFP